jgi:uncharacterized membrane protein
MQTPRLRRGTVVGAAAALVVAGLAVPSASRAAVTARYTIVDLGSLGSGDFSVATAINNAGQVVGYGNPTPFTTHAFR